MNSCERLFIFCSYHRPPALHRNLIVASRRIIANIKCARAVDKQKYVQINVILFLYLWSDSVVFCI